MLPVRWVTAATSKDRCCKVTFAPPYRRSLHKLAADQAGQDTYITKLGFHSLAPKCPRTKLATSLEEWCLSELFPDWAKIAAGKRAVASRSSMQICSATAVPIRCTRSNVPFCVSLPTMLPRTASISASFAGSGKLAAALVGAAWGTASVGPRRSAAAAAVDCGGLSGLARCGADSVRCCWFWSRRRFFEFFSRCFLGCGVPLPPPVPPGPARAGPLGAVFVAFRRGFCEFVCVRRVTWQTESTSGDAS
jgi:hypothetical protein